MKCLNETEPSNFQFMPILQMCMKSKDFKIDTFFNNLIIKREDVILASDLFTGSKFVSLGDLVWSTVFHNK